MEDAFADPRRIQEQKLLDILRRNDESVFGRERGFASIRSAAEFRRRIRVTNYDALSPYVHRALEGEKNVLTADDPVFFAVTSGSTGPRKFIPVNRTLEKELADAQFYWLALTIRDDSRIGEGKFLYLAPPAFDGVTESGVPYGSIAGTIFGRQNRKISPLLSAILARRGALPAFVSRIGDPALKNHLAARLAVRQNLGSINSANPSTIAFFFKHIQGEGEALVRETREGGISPRLAANLGQDFLGDLRSRLKPDRKAAARLEAAFGENPLDPRKIWPGLRIVQCWLGGTLSFYLSEMRRYTRDLPLRDVGYRASEGFFAIPMANDTAAGALNVAGHFFEFEEDGSSSGETRLAAELEAGGRYRLIVTQSGGLYRYDMEDIIEVESFYKRTPLIRFLHKTGGTLSVTGEKVTESQFLRAMQNLRKARDLGDVEFALAVREEMPPRYVLFLERRRSAAPALPEADDIARRLDEELRRANCEYESKRASGRLAPLRTVAVRPESFAEFRRAFLVLGESDAQFKPRYLLSRPEERAWLEARALGPS